MKKYFTRNVFVIGMLTIVILLTLTVSRGVVSAAGESATLMKKWIFTNYRNCLASDSQTPLYTRDNNSNVSDFVFSDTGSKYLPSYDYQHTVSTPTMNLPTLSCKDFLIGGTGGIKGALDYYDSALKTVKWSNYEGASSFLTNDIGYEFVGGENGEQIFKISAACKRTETRKNLITGKLKAPEQVDCDGDTVSVTVTPKSDGTYYSYSGLANLGEVLKVNIHDKKFEMWLFEGNGDCEAAGDFPVIIPLEADPEVFYEKLGSALTGKTWSRTCIYHPNEKSRYRKIEESFYFSTSKENVVNTAEKGSFTYNDATKKSRESTLKLAGVSNLKDLVLTKDEKYSLYFYYLGKYLPTNVQNRATCNPTGDNPGDYLYSIKLRDSDGEFKQCYVNLNGQDPSATEVTTQFSGSRGENPYIDKTTMQAVLDWLDTVNTNDLADVPTIDKIEGGSGVVVDGDGNVIDPNDSDLDNKQNECYNGSGSLGWIICPIIEMADGVGQHMWEQIEEYHLKIPASEVFKSGGGVETGWNAVRNIANVIFIILFLVVIFSQLTGVGIDNYGIKKILPRLIVIAILVNLSYLICELAVDLSNIFGMGLNNMLSSWAGDIVGSTGQGAGAQVGAWALTAILGGGGVILFSTLKAGSFAGGLMGIGLAALGIIIVIIVAMLTLYLILIAREAGVVLCIIVAPVAIVCYALPNTEKLAKKWFDLFKALMVVYPICGAMVGGGQLAGSILASIDNPGMKVAAMIVQVLPFFLVPMLLKSSLALMGNVGARLSTLGRNIGRRSSAGVRGAIQNSERFKDFSQFHRENAMERRARRTREGVNILGRRVGGLANRNPNTLSERQRDRLRKADDTLLAQRKQSEENRLRTQGGYYDAMVNKQDLSIEAEADAIARLNDPTVLASERSALAEKARLERSKARTTLLANRYSGEGLEQLQARWNAAFDSNHADDLDALTNVMMQRYGTSAANSIASRLGEISIIGNSNRQDSMRTLQRTMNDNSTFANNMRSKAPDAFQMVSEAGTHYDAATGGTTYEDLSYFSGNNIIATQAKDWATASGATLQRAVDNGAMSERMLEELLTSDDPSIRSGLQSEDGKREILEAALYNMRHNPSGTGTNLDNATASARYQAERATINNRAALEADALRIGKTTITVGPNIATGAPATTFEGYAAPAGFNTGGAAPVLDVHSGHYIYTDPTTGARWNASTGRFMP